MKNFELHLTALKEELAEIRDQLRLMRSFILFLLGGGLLVPLLASLTSTRSVREIVDSPPLGLIISMVMILAISLFVRNEIKRQKLLHDKKVQEIRDLVIVIES